MTAQKKRVEAFMLAAARKAGIPIPNGGTADETPDFRFNDERPALGIELSEVIRPANSNHGILPAEQESFHAEIIKQAQNEYSKSPNTKPVQVSVYFTNTGSQKGDKKGLTRALTEFVKANVGRASPFVRFYKPATPDGFESVGISNAPDNWWCGESGGFTLADIRQQITAAIFRKNKRVRVYRANLPAAARIWLLLYSGVTVARGIMIPHGIETWTFSFQFDRVFWYSALQNQFAEIRSEEANNGAPAC